MGVGAQSDSCLGRDGPCQECSNNCESYCAKVVGTYASVHRNGAKSYGGHGSYHRCPSHFVIRIPEGLAPEHAAPLLCGGITVYSPLKHFGAGPGTKVAVAGVGGLGHFLLSSSLKHWVLMKWLAFLARPASVRKLWNSAAMNTSLPMTMTAG